MKVKNESMAYRWAFLWVVLVLSLALSACGSPRKETKPSLDWSRSVEVGESLTGSLGFWVEGPGERIHMVWPYTEEDTGLLLYVQLDQFARRRLESTLNFPGLTRSPRLVPAGEGRSHLFWAKRSSGEKNWTLWHVLLSPDGQLANDLHQVSASNMNVGDYAVISDGEDGVLVAFGGFQAGDIYLSRLDSQGLLRSGPRRISTAGENPSLRLDNSGVVHLAWLEDSFIRYNTVALDDFEPGEWVNLFSPQFSMGTRLAGPEVGLSEGWVYVFWSVLNQSGLAAGTASTQYIAFPDGQARPSNPDDIRVFSDEEQPYRPVQTTFNLSQLASPVDVATFSSDFILNPRATDGELEQLIISFSANQDYRLNAHLQPVVGVFEKGNFIGYSFAGKTRRISDETVIAIDDLGQIHLAWREASGGRYAYYATTAEKAREQLDKLEAGDFIEAFLQGGLESFATIALLPIVGFGWILPGFFILGLWKLFRDYENLHDPVSWAPLVLALVVFYGIKLTSLPTITTYVPFTAWLDVPRAFWDVLRIGVPVLIALAALVAGIAAVRRRSNSTLTFYIAATLVDSLLTLAIYGVNFLGQF